MSLELIIGPMFASKSTELISKLQRLSCIGQPVLAVNHIWDKKRHEDEDKNDQKNDDPSKNDQNITSHHGWKFPALYAATLKEVREHEQYHQAQVVAIDEGQFFPDLAEQVRHMVEKDHKKVYVAALNGSAERTLMGQIGELLPLIDDIRFETAFCAICRDGVTKGIFSMRRSKSNPKSEIQPEKGIVQIGAEDLYVTVCRKHYLEHHQQS